MLFMPVTSFHLEGERFLLKLLTEDDVTERYVGWLRDSATSEYIFKKLYLANLKA